MCHYPVNSDDGIGLFPFSPTESCCGSVNFTSGACEDATQGSSAPFAIPVGLVINNRTSGSTAPNDTSAAATLIGTSTMTATSTASVAAGSTSSSRDQAAIGAGVGVPLGLALLAALAMLWRQRRRERDLKVKAETWEKRYDALAKAKGLDYREDDALMQRGKDGPRHQLEDARIEELDGSRARDVHEMAGWKSGPA
ncbi:MAG: hypothetical protein ASARMPRED_000758 [Alectoria sarmentosa]|nr:MAG: hypothetical protein ASARMPRED_000758 [Alectoria sarmentosa]